MVIEPSVAFRHFREVACEPACDLVSLTAVLPRKLGQPSLGVFTLKSVPKLQSLSRYWITRSWISLIAVLSLAPQPLAARPSVYRPFSGAEGLI